MSNKFTGITSAGQNVPVYDKAAHSAIDSVSGYISAHEDSWTATNLPETISAKEVDLYGTSNAYKNKLTINGFEAHVAPDGVNAPSAIYGATNANLYNPTNDSWTVITPGSVRVQTSAEEYTLAPPGGLALRSKSTTDNIMVGVKGMSGRASNAASFSVGVKGLKINDGQQSIFCGAEGFDYTDFSNSMNVKITPQNGLQQTYREGGVSKTVYLKDIGKGGGGLTASVNTIPVDSLVIETNWDTANPHINDQELHIYNADNAYHADRADYADNAYHADYATSADYATYDSEGNNIVDTYAKKTDSETVLWEGVQGTPAKDITISEPYTNFEFVKFVFNTRDGNHGCVKEFSTDKIPNGTKFCLSDTFFDNETSDSVKYVSQGQSVQFDADDHISAIQKDTYKLQITGTNSVSLTTNSAQFYLTIYKVIGINRK